MHQISEIRLSAQAILKNGFQRVFAHRAVAPQDSVLPCVFVYCDGRSSEFFNQAPEIIRHEVRLNVVCVVQADKQGDEIAEMMLQRVEQLLMANPRFCRSADGIEIYALADDLQFESLNIDVDETGELPTLYYQQTFKAYYFDDLRKFGETADVADVAITPENMKASTLDYFNEQHIEWATHEDGNIHAIDFLKFNEPRSVKND